jgi:TPR repeat protein
MKRVLTILSLILIAQLGVYAQTGGSLSEAISAYEAGNTKGAIDAIDKSILNEHARKLPETWYYRGFFYLDYYKKNETGKVDAPSRNVAQKSCEKCVEMDNTASREWAIECEKFLAQISKYHYNDGAIAFNNKDYRMAYSEFLTYIEMAKKYDPTNLDKRVYTSVGVSAYRIKQPLQAVKFLEEARLSGDKSYLTYYYLASSYWESGERNRAFIILSEGERQNPDKVKLIELHLQYLKETGDLSDSEQLLLKAIALDPDNINYMILLAIQYEKFADTFKGEPRFEYYIDKARFYYAKVLEVDQNHLQANYNLGLLYYNHGVTIANNLDLDADILTIYETQDKVTELFNKALPFMQKSYQLDGKKRDTLIALQNIYTALNDEEKASYFKELLDNL